MVGEQYYLFLILNNGERLRTFDKGMTLKEMDRRTTRYKDKKSLIKQILSNTNTNISIDDVDDVLLVRRPNSKKDEYVKEFGPLYSDDVSVLNEDKTCAEFEINAHDPKFVLHFIKSYSKIKNFRETACKIYAIISDEENYFEELQRIIDKVSKTYKGIRNIYLSMKFYEEKKEKQSKRKITLKETDEPIYEPTDEEIRENELLYLIEHDRELLDLSDFDDFPLISPFDKDRRR